MAKKQTPPEPTEPEPKGAAAFAAMTSTPEMAAVGLDWTGVYAFAEQAVQLVQDHGDKFLSLLRNGFKAFQAITGRDFMGIFAALNAASVDLQELIAAIKEEFGIE